MLCEKCGKNIATTHIKTVVNGAVHKLSLCNECAAMEGYGDIGSLQLGQMLASFFGDTDSRKIANTELRCDCCNSSFSDIAKSGRAGCPECYKTFYNELLPYIKRIHGSTHHSGIAPHTEDKKAPAEETVDELRAELLKLIEQENFEQAAVIRDKIKVLEENGNE